VDGAITGLGEVKLKFFWESLLIWVFEIVRGAREVEISDVWSVAIASRGKYLAAVCSTALSDAVAKQRGAEHRR
jgi:hypothetical protein